MVRYWKFLGVVLAIAILGVVMVAAAPSMKPDQGGQPEIVNFFPTITDGTPGDCTDGLDYQVPADKSLHITDVVWADTQIVNLHFWTDVRGAFVNFDNFGSSASGHNELSFMTPLVIDPDERFCLSTSSGSVDLFISGLLVP